MNALRVEVVGDRNSLLAIGREWDALVTRAGIEHPFLSHDWVRTWWECFGADNELYILAVRSGEDLIGLAPLMRTRTRAYGVPIRRLEFVANVHTPRFDFIVGERAEEVYVAILDYIQTQGPRWDILMLPELTESSRTEVQLRRLAKARSLRTGVWIAGTSPRIPLVGSFDAFQAALSSKRRSSLRRYMRHLAALGAISIEEVSDLDRLSKAMADGLRLEAAGWKGDAGTAIAESESLERFYTLIAERAARSGTLSLLFLKTDEKRIAFAYCLRNRSTLYVLKTGYDPEYAAYSPFNVLMTLAIESAFNKGFETLDLLGGDDPWKRAWTHECIERRWLYLYCTTVRARVLYHLKFTLLPRLKRKRAQPTVEGEHPRAMQTASMRVKTQL
jgi:CelD/BcsL family acetyltransferase involved in cellulose biosynthesis